MHKRKGITLWVIQLLNCLKFQNQLSLPYVHYLKVIKVDGIFLWSSVGKVARVDFCIMPIAVKKRTLKKNCDKNYQIFKKY